MTSKFSVEDANTYIESRFGDDAAHAKLIKMKEASATMRCVARPFHLNRDGFFSAPTLMSFSDSISFFSILTVTGTLESLRTTNLNISFLKPCVGPIAIAEGRIVKIGTSLATIEAEVRSEGDDEAACRAIITYSLPRKR